MGRNNLKNLPKTLGRVVQVDPKKATLHAPKCERLMGSKLWWYAFKSCFQIQLAPLQLGNLTALTLLYVNDNQLMR